MLLSVHLTTSLSGIKVVCWLILQTRLCTMPTSPGLIKVKVPPALRASSNRASSNPKIYYYHYYYCNTPQSKLSWIKNEKPFPVTHPSWCRHLLSCDLVWMSSPKSQGKVVEIQNVLIFNSFTINCQFNMYPTKNLLAIKCL